MPSFSSLLKGIGVGAAAMYLFDPVAGRRRRSLLRDQCESALNATHDFVDCGIRDLNNRLQGIAAETRASLSTGSAPDHVIAKRVRACMGHYITHARAIDVHVDQGRVVLSGPILADEVPALLAAVSEVRGVQQVDQQLDVHEQGDVPSLQGGFRRTGQQAWSPATSLLVSAAGLALIGKCLQGRTPTSVLWGTAGFGLFVSAVSSRPSQKKLLRRNQRGGSVAAQQEREGTLAVEPE